MISDSNQITAPRREVSHGMSMAVSHTLGSLVSLRTRASFKMMTTLLPPLLPQEHSSDPS